MGGIVKPLIRLEGVPLIRRQLIALSGAGVDEVVVVTGYAGAAVEREVRSFPITLAHNPAYAEGRQSSVRVGLGALEGEFDAVLISLADQPLIGAGDLIELIAAFKKRPVGHVLVPVVEAQRGNPIVLDDFARAEILAAGTNLACRHFIDRHPELVHAYATGNRRFVADLDTIEDLRLLAGRTGWRLELPA